MINTNPGLLASGQLDAEFMYINKAQDAGLSYITFPDQINLSNPADASTYATASYTTNIGQTFRGAPIQVSIAPLRNGNTRAALQTIRLLTSPQGAALLAQFHFLPSPLLAGGDLDAIPLSLQFQIRGTYRPPAP